MNQYYGAYPPQSLTPQQAAALGGWQNNQNLQQMQGVGIQNGYSQQFVQAIPGRMIHDIQEVRPNEVPNNGTVAIFPKDDMSCVYVKYLSNVGKIETMTFVPMAQTAENPPENGELPGIYEVAFSGNIAGVAAGTVQLSISAGNAVLPGSNMIVTSTAAGDAFNVAKTMLLGTGCGMYDVIRIVNTGTAALTVSPGANLIVRKLS